jgi:hypothetical protein
MEITIETTEQDHIDFYRDYSLKRKWLQRLLILLAVDFLVSSFVPMSSVYLVNVFFIGIILAPFFIGIPYLLSKKRITNAYEKSPRMIGKKTYKPFATGIEITDETGITFLKYEDIKQVGKAGNFIFLILLDGSYYLLPIWYFSSVHEAGHFLSIVTNGIANVKGIEPKTPLTFKPIYLIGILCFIPLLGAIAGVVLIILGIVHFRDKVFIFIGAAGILFTVALYGSLFYVAENSGFADKGFAKIAQTQLNDLVKSIEFYKLQNGSYPDSLQQIETKDSFISIDDPLQTFKQKKTVTYQYHRIGSKYLLFSVGKDGKPNTPDDIYPTLTSADTSKLGFIRKPGSL